MQSYIKFSKRFKVQNVEALLSEAHTGECLHEMSKFYKSDTVQRDLSKILLKKYEFRTFGICLSD